MIDLFFWGTGVACWTVIGVLLSWVFAEVCVGFACAVSWCRWAHRMMKVHKRAPNWPGFTSTFVRRWRDLIGRRNNRSDLWRGSGGYWYGIGDWAVFQPVDQQEEGR